MNYYKATEKYLYNYKSFKANIVNMETQIEEIDYYSVKAVGYDYIDDIGYRGSTVENAIINIDKKRNDLENKIVELKSKLERIDKAIEALNEIEQQIISERYFEGRQWWQIAYKLRYSERWCKELRSRAVEKISIGLWGEEALPKDFPFTSPSKVESSI